MLAAATGRARRVVIHPLVPVAAERGNLLGPRLAADSAGEDPRARIRAGRLDRDDALVPHMIGVIRVRDGVLHDDGDVLVVHAVAVPVKAVAIHELVVATLVLLHHGLRGRDVVDAVIGYRAGAHPLGAAAVVVKPVGNLRVTGVMRTLGHRDLETGAPLPALVAEVGVGDLDHLERGLVGEDNRVALDGRAIKQGDVAGVVPRDVELARPVADDLAAGGKLAFGGLRVEEGAAVDLEAGRVTGEHVPHARTLGVLAAEGTAVHGNGTLLRIYATGCVSAIAATTDDEAATRRGQRGTIGSGDGAAVAQHGHGRAARRAHHGRPGDPGASDGLAVEVERDGLAAHHDALSVGAHAAQQDDGIAVLGGRDGLGKRLVGGIADLRLDDAVGAHDVIAAVLAVTYETSCAVLRGHLVTERTTRDARVRARREPDRTQGRAEGTAGHEQRADLAAAAARNLVDGVAVVAAERAAGDADVHAARVASARVHVDGAAGHVDAVAVGFAVDVGAAARAGDGAAGHGERTGLDADAAVGAAQATAGDGERAGLRMVDGDGVRRAHGAAGDVDGGAAICGQAVAGDAEAGSANVAAVHVEPGAVARDEDTVVGHDHAALVAGRTAVHDADAEAIGGLDVGQPLDVAAAVDQDARGAMADDGDGLGGKRAAGAHGHGVGVAACGNLDGAAPDGGGGAGHGNRRAPGGSELLAAQVERDGLGDGDALCQGQVLGDDDGIARVGGADGLLERLVTGTVDGGCRVGDLGRQLRERRSQTLDLGPHPGDLGLLELVGAEHGMEAGSGLEGLGQGILVLGRGCRDCLLVGVGKGLELLGGSRLLLSIVLGRALTVVGIAHGVLGGRLGLGDRVGRLIGGCDVLILVIDDAGGSLLGEHRLRLAGQIERLQDRLSLAKGREHAHGQEREG